MATITVRGYVNKPETKNINGKKLAKFTLSEKVKDPKSEKGHYRTFYNVDQWECDPPAEGSYVEVQGYFKARKFKRADGTESQSLDIKANDIVIPEGSKQPAATGDQGSGDQFDF